MQFSSWPRHQLRAQGRRIRRPEEALPGTEEIVEPAHSQSSITKSARLLNFLSKSAAQSEREILAPKPIPDFARVNLSIGADPNWERDLREKRQERAKRNSLAKSARTSRANERQTGASLLGRLADTLTAEAGIGAAHRQMSPDLVALTTDNDPSKVISPDCLAALDDWFGCTSDPEVAREKAVRVGIVDPFLQMLPVLPSVLPPALPAALPAVMPSSYSGYDELGDEDEDIGDHAIRPAEPALSGRVHKADSLPRRGASFKRAQFNRNVRYKPELRTLAHGAREETFENGAILIKDALGRVVEIQSNSGVQVAIRYDEEGQPQAFRRLDSEELHSFGERDTHGVVVRDPQGRVRAAGESIAVDPNGCLSIRRFDGQFWSLDLVKGVHIERRNVADREGNWHALTALFAEDGFRMVTRFQRVEDKQENQCVRSCASSQLSGRFRFYGRDGSVIQFESEDDLLELKPAKIWHPGSRNVDPAWGGHLQAGTAWESVQEYVTNYLLA